MEKLEIVAATFYGKPVEVLKLSESGSSARIKYYHPYEGMISHVVPVEELVIEYQTSPKRKTDECF